MARTRSPGESRGTPLLSFRVGLLRGPLDARIDSTIDASSRAQVAQRDLGRYYALLDAGLREIRRLRLSEAQCSALCDVLTGTLMLSGLAHGQDAAEPAVAPESIYDHLAQELSDADQLNGLGEKWNVSIPALLDRLRELSPLGLWALVDAVERWWHHPQLTDLPTIDLHRAVGLIDAAEY